jgi:hypothetical protein
MGISAHRARLRIERQKDLSGGDAEALFTLGFRSGGTNWNAKSTRCAPFSSNFHWFGYRLLEESFAGAAAILL